MPVKYKGSRSVHRPLKSKLNEQTEPTVQKHDPNPMKVYSSFEMACIALYFILLMIFAYLLFYHIAA